MRRTAGLLRSTKQTTGYREYPDAANCEQAKPAGKEVNEFESRCAVVARRVAHNGGTISGRGMAALTSHAVTDHSVRHIQRMHDRTSSVETQYGSYGAPY